MKHFNHFKLCMIGLLLLTAQTGYTQASNPTSVHKQDKDYVSDNGSSPDIENTRINSGINSRVLHSFYENFKNASDLKWDQSENKYYVGFTIDGKKARALFTKRGTLVYSIFYGNENSMPAEKRNLVKNGYPCYTISLATQVKQYDRTIWIVSLENADNLVYVRIEEDELEETKRYQKSK